MNLNFNTIIRFALPYLYIVLFSYMIGLGFFFVLPTTQVVTINEQKESIPYKKYNIKEVYKQQKQIQQPIKIEKPKEYALISNIELQAVYANDDGTGFIIIKEKTQARHIC